MPDLNSVPRTWVAGETVTAAEMNAEIRDALTNLQSSWTSYTPTPTNWVLGNGTSACAYRRNGKTLRVRMRFVFGSTSSWSSSLGFGLPAATHASYQTRDPLGTVTMVDASSGTIKVQNVGWSASTTAILMDAAGVVVSNTVPWTWATGDTIAMELTYEAA